MGAGWGRQTWRSSYASHGSAQHVQGIEGTVFDKVCFALYLNMDELSWSHFFGQFGGFVKVYSGF